MLPVNKQTLMDLAEMITFMNDLQFDVANPRVEDASVILSMRVVIDGSILTQPLLVLQGMLECFKCVIKRMAVLPLPLHQYDKDCLQVRPGFVIVSTHDLIYLTAV